MPAATISSCRPREMHKVLHGDRVTAKRIGFDRRGRPEGEIVDVLKRANRDVVGRIHEERGVWFVEAENRRINQDLMIPPDGRGNAQPGQVVVVEIVEPPSEHREAVARVKEVLGSATDSGIEIEIALRKHALPFEWSAAAERQAQRLPKDVRPADRKGRTDLTHLPLVTIDGESAKDFDDAVYCEPDGRGFRLIVAIADVSHYVRDGDALDADARERGTSVYFPRRVIPMLPEALSNELCSLKPAVDRLCMACDMRIDARGAITSYTFYPATMHSRARLTYTQVYQWLTEPGTATAEPARALLPHLAQLYTLYKVLFARARATRGDRLRHGRAGTRVRRARQDRADRARAAQRRAQADRGVHARSERLRRRFPREARAACAVPHPRYARPRTSLPPCANFSAARR